jgi:ethanolamine utilization protein EutN
VFLAKVVGNLVASAKYPSLKGQRLLILQPLDVHLKIKGKMLISTDSLGTGYGEIVMAVTSKEAGIPYKHFDPLVPTDACVVGIIDQVDLTGVCDICRDITCSRMPGGDKATCKAKKKSAATKPKAKKKPAGKKNPAKKTKKKETGSRKSASVRTGSKGKTGKTKTVKPKKGGSRS